MPTAVELFAGVGGFGIALEQNNFDVVAQVEIDKHAQNVLRNKFSTSQLFKDVTEVTGDQLRAAGFVSDGGIITGGFPCQDLSVGGRRAGLAGKRSGLFYEFARIIEETETEWVILENVPGLLSSREGRDMGAVIGTLAELGYGCAWRVLDAKEFGVPQRRRRVFIVAKRFADASSCVEVLFKRASVRGDSEEGGSSRQELATQIGASPNGPDQEVVYGQAGYGTYAPGVKTLNASMQKRPEDSIVVQNEGIVFYNHHSEPARIQGDFVNTLPAHMGTGGNNMPLMAEIVSFTTSNYSDLAGWEKPHYPTLSATPPNETAGLQYGIREGNTVRRLTPLECERLQGFPDHWTALGTTDAGEIIEQPDTSRYKQLGNAIAVPVVHWIINGITSI